MWEVQGVQGKLTAEMGKVSGNSGAASANLSQLCEFLVLACASFFAFLAFLLFFAQLRFRLPIFCVLIFQAQSFACAILYIFYISEFQYVVPLQTFEDRPEMPLWELEDPEVPAEG